MRHFSMALAMVIVAMSTHCLAQKSPVKFGEVSLADLKMTESEIDPSAGAEYLLMWGLTSFDGEFETVLSLHTRIKILNKNELDRGNIKIPYFRGDAVSGLKAVTYNLENGRVVESKVKNSDVFDERIQDDLRSKNFSMPDLKVGSIIEYKYNVKYGGWRSLNPWYFEMDIPIRHNEYNVSVPEYFDYKQILSGYGARVDYGESTATKTYGSTPVTLNKKHYIARNVPPFKEEPYMTTKEDYVKKVRYELSSINIPGVFYQTYLPPNYGSLSRTYANEEYFGTDLLNNGFLKDVVAVIIADANSEADKIQKIYEFVHDEIDHDDEYESDRLRAVLKDRKGSCNDINRLLVAMLREAGIQADPVRISTRDHGRVHPTYAMTSNFNHTIVCANADEKDYLMDAGFKGYPFGMLPKECLNGQGLVISDDNPRWVDLEGKKGDVAFFTGKFVIEDDGIMTGDLKLSRGGYNAEDFRTSNKGDLDDFKQDFATSHSSWFIDNHEIEGMDDLGATINHKLSLEFDDHVEVMDDLIIFNPFVHGRQQENPFESEERKYPVNFNTKKQVTMSYQIQLPDGVVVDEVPQPLRIALPNKGGSYVCQIQPVGNTLNVLSKMRLDKIEFSPDEYPYLREFYAQMVAKQAESVVLKRQ